MMDSTTPASDPPVLLAGVIAVIGCDGSGKSTLTHDLLTRLSEQRAVERRYLGLVSGEMGDKIKRLPLIGRRLEHYLANKARRAQDRRQQLPGTGTAIVMYLLSIWRTRQFRKMVALSQRGVVVIADRYPQAEIPGFNYDGPGLPDAGCDTWIVRKLAVREIKRYRWMASHLPSLVIRLNIDLGTALARKPDHRADEIADKIAVAPRLRFNGAHIVDIDARVPYAQVLDTALQAAHAAIDAGRR